MKVPILIAGEAKDCGAFRRFLRYKEYPQAKKTDDSAGHPS